MVWVRRRTLWGREETKKGNTTVPFFSGDKVLLDGKALDAPKGGWGQGAPWRCHRMKLLSMPRNSSTLWVAGNDCRPRALSNFIQTGSRHTPNTLPRLKPLPSGSTLMEKFIATAWHTVSLQSPDTLSPWPSTSSPHRTSPRLQPPRSWPPG